MAALRATGVPVLLDAAQSLGAKESLGCPRVGGRRSTAFPAVKRLKGSPLPIPGALAPLRVLVMRPKVLLVGLTPGAAKLLKLKILKISTRNSLMTFSVTGVCLKREKST